MKTKLEKNEALALLKKYNKVIRKMLKLMKD